MIDTLAILYLKALKLHPDFVNHLKEFAAKHHLPPPEETSTTTSHGRPLKIFTFLNGAIRITAAEQDGGWHIIKIRCNIGRILYRHNGHTLHSNKEIAMGLARLKSIVQRVLVTGQDDLIIPGMDRTGNAFYSTLECNRHLLDPNRTLLTAFMNSRHPAIRKAPLFCHGESFALKGKYARLSIYAKDLQMAEFLQNQGMEEIPPVLRVEVILLAEMLWRYIRNESCFCGIDGKHRLVRFSIEDLHAAYLKFLSEITGVMALSDGQPVKGINGSLAKIAKTWDIPLPDLLKVYEETKPVTKRQMSVVRREAHAHLARLSELTVDELFSEESFLAQPQIEIPRLEDNRPALTDDEMRDARDIWWVYTNQSAKGAPTMPKQILFDMAN